MTTTRGRGGTMKMAQLTPDKISSDKRTISLEEGDYEALNRIIAEVKENTTQESTICTARPKQNKSQKRKAKKKEKAALMEQAAKEFGAELDKGEKGETKEEKGETKEEKGETKEEKGEEKGEIVTSSLPSSSPSIDKALVSGYSMPTLGDNGLLQWNKGDIFPPVLLSTYNVVLSMFGGIKKEDIDGCKLSLYPPSDNKSIVTYVPKAAANIMARVVLVAGSIENLTFEVAQGRTDATCEFPLFKDQCILIKFGIAGTVEFSFNNETSFLYKMKTGSRGMHKSKYPKSRWIMVFDFMSKDGVMDRELKNLLSSDTNISSMVDRKYNGIIPDTEKVISMARNKMEIAALNKLSASTLDASTEV